MTGHISAARKTMAAVRLSAGRAACTALGLLIAVFASSLSAWAQTGGYSDVGGGFHDPSIDALSSDSRGILIGTDCSAGRFCPGDPLPRWVMAVWLVRALDGDDPDGSGGATFADVDSGQWWAAHADRLADLGVTKGCRIGPPRYCPDEPVTRGQMASFLARALDLPEPTSGRFSDTAENTHENDIDRIAEAGITAGCTQDRYCPDRLVTRAEMATFLARALKLVPLPVSTPSTDGYRFAYAVYGDGKFDGEIWTTTLDGVKTNIVDGTDWSAAAFSPDGRWIAYQEYNSAYVLNIDSGARRYISGVSGDVYDFHWSSDSKFLAYMTYTADNQSGWVEEADGQNKRRLTHNPERIPPFKRGVSPFSPDGKFILYQVNSEHRRLTTGVPPVVILGRAGEYIVENLSSGSKVRFTSEFFGNSVRYGPELGFTPDSQRIYYPVASPRYDGLTEFGQTSDYWIMDTDGSNKRKIASRSINALAWSLDGTRFVFRSNKVTTTSKFYDGPDGPRRLDVMVAGDFKLADANGVVLGEIERAGACDAIVWQPDNENIIFAYSRNPKMAKASTLSVRDIEDHELNTTAWSPDGLRKAYYVLSEDYPNDWNGQLWISDADGTRKTKLADYGHGSVQWSPDGKHVAYTVVRWPYGSTSIPIRDELWIADSDGKNRWKVVGIEPTEDTLAGLPNLLTWLPAR